MKRSHHIMWVMWGTLFLFNVGCDNVEFEEMPTVLNQSLTNQDDLCKINESPDCEDQASPTDPGDNANSDDPVVALPPDDIVETPEPNNPDTPDDPVVNLPEEPKDPVVDPTPVDPRTAQALESFEQTSGLTESGASKLDILVMVDTSLSTRNDRSSLYRRFKGIFNAMAHIDWNMGITTTALDYRYSLNGELYPVNRNKQRVMNRSMQKLEEAFNRTIGFDMCGVGDGYNSVYKEPCTDGHEEALRATLAAFDKMVINNQLVRPDADLAIIYISDEDEKRTIGPTVKPDEVLQNFAARFGDSKAFRAYGAIIQPGDAECLKAQSGPFAEPDASYGLAIDELATKTGGHTLSICQNDLSGLFKSVAQDFDNSKVPGGEELKDHFVLEFEPLSDESIRIRINGEIVSNWTREGKTIYFETSPPALSQIEVSYEYLIPEQ